MSAVEGASARERKRAYDRARNEALPDAIVLRSLIRGTRLTREDIPPNLIEAKRGNILLRRALRELTHTLADTSDT